MTDITDLPDEPLPPHPDLEGRICGVTTTHLAIERICTREPHGPTADGLADHAFERRWPNGDR